MIKFRVRFGIKLNLPFGLFKNAGIFVLRNLNEDQFVSVKAAVENLKLHIPNEEDRARIVFEYDLIG